MRQAAQRSLEHQDMFPANGSIYMADPVCGADMAKALRDWEKRRGLVFSFKGKFIQPGPKKEIEEKPKAQKKPADTIRVPRDLPLTPQQKKDKQNEQKRKWRKANRERAAEASRKWKAARTPEQRRADNLRSAELRRARKAMLAVRSASA